MPGKGSKMSSAIALKKERKKLFERLKKNTHFTLHECEYLAKKYDDLCGDEPLNIGIFRNYLIQTFHMTDIIMLDRIFRVFDQDNDNKISLEEWIKGLSTYCRGTLEEHARFCFCIYDTNSNGNISREEMFQFLRHCIAAKPSHDDDPEEEGAKELVEIASKYMGDKNITFEVFLATVMKENLWIECLGPCIPCETYIQEFEERIKSGKLI